VGIPTKLPKDVILPNLRISSPTIFEDVILFDFKG
jgi:hypothetical protein